MSNLDDEGIQDNYLSPKFKERDEKFTAFFSNEVAAYLPFS